jgi:hypothetical protein
LCFAAIWSALISRSVIWRSLSDIVCLLPFG